MTDQQVIYIDVENQKSKISLVNPLRVLKGKRAVFEAIWKGDTVLVKLFSKEKYWLREQKGLSFLNKFELASPQCLYSGSVSESNNLHQFGLKSEQPVYILILEFYQNAQDFRSRWRSEGLHNKQRKVLFSKLLVLLAQHHQVGVLQNDLHLGNFLIVNENLITIDGDAVGYTHLLSVKECYRQLGILLAQSFPKYDALLEGLLEHYFDERQIEINPHTIKQIVKSREIARHIAKKNWINKAYRESTQFKVIKTFKSHICIARAFAENELETKVLGLTKITDKSVKWADKSYKYKATRYTNTINSERRWLDENEASIYWLNAQLKVFFGERTVTPVALVLNKIGPFHISGFFVQASARVSN